MTPTTDTTDATQVRALQRGLSGAVEAWKLFPVRIGFIATLAITLGSLSPAYLPQASPLSNIFKSIHLDGNAGKIVGTLLAVAGVFLLADAWFRLRHTVYRVVSHLWIVAIWSIPILFAPPVFSHDAYSYAAQGWMVHNGQNPYGGGPGYLPGTFADMVSWVWRYTPAPYGPLSLQVQHWIVDLSGFHAWIAAWLMRIPAVIGVGLAVIFLPKIAVRMGFNPDRVIWFACLNPLLIIDFVGGCHNDSLMMGLTILALWIATHPRWWYAAAVVLGVAAAIKQPALLASWALPLLTVPLSSWRHVKEAAIAIARSVLSVAIAVGAFCLVSVATGLGFGWINAMKVPGLVGSISPTWLIGATIQAALDPENSQYIQATGNVFLVLGVIAIAFFIIRYGPKEPLRALGWSYIAAALAQSALHSWYMLWGFLLLPLVKGRRQIPWVTTMLILFLLTYNVIDFGDRNGTVGQIIVYATVPLWLLHLVIYHKLWRRFRRRPHG